MTHELPFSRFPQWDWGNWHFAQNQWCTPEGYGWNRSLSYQKMHFVDCFPARDVIFTIAQANYQQRVGDD